MAYIEIDFGTGLTINKEEFHSIEGLRVNYSPEPKNDRNIMFYTRHGRRVYNTLIIKRKVQHGTLDSSAIWKWFKEGGRKKIIVEVKDHEPGEEEPKVIQTITLNEAVPISWFIEFSKEEEHVLECLEIAPYFIEVGK